MPTSGLASPNLRLDSELSQTSAEVVRDGVRLVVVHPLVLSQRELLEHLPILLDLFCLPEDLTRPQTILIAILSHGKVEGLCDGVHLKVSV